MKKALIMIGVTALMVMVACKDEEAISKAPEFEALTLTPSTCAPGDTLMLKVPFKKGEEGANFYFVEYVCSGITPLVPTAKDSEKGIYLGAKVPEFKCKAPNKAGTFKVTFKGKVSYTGNKVVNKNGITTSQLYGETNTVETTLIVN